MSGVNLLMAKLIYGCGLRLHECLQLRVKDIDFEQNVVIIRSGLGHKHLQTTMIYTHVASKNILGVRSPLDK